MNAFPEHITVAETVCALRFLGYEYEQVAGIAHPDVVGGGLSDLIQPVVTSLTFHHRENDNFAAFFGLQRFLHKWGGERLTKYSREHLAYDLLFLHLYRAETPGRFTDEEYSARWRAEFQGDREAVAAYVRRSLRRRGRGPTFT